MSDSSSDEGPGLFTTRSAKGGIVNINFHIDPDLPDSLVEWLKSSISTRDGRVAERIPKRGFILVDIKSESAARYQKDYPDYDDADGSRRVVDWKFVPACIEKNRIISLDEMPRGTGVFDGTGDDGIPVHIFTKGNAGMDTLLRYAYHLCLHGAGLVDKEEEASYIICDPKIKAYQRLKTKYADDQQVHIVPPDWISQSIKSGRVKEPQRVPVTSVTVPIRRGMPFTEEEDQQLILYLAEVCPVNVKYKTSRLAQSQYDELVNNLGKYPWAANHPAQGWREHYKKNKAELDARIDAVVKHLSKSKGKRNATTLEDMVLAPAKRVKKSEPAPGPSRSVPEAPSASTSRRPGTLRAVDLQEAAKGPQYGSQRPKPSQRSTAAIEMSQEIAAEQIERDDDSAPLPLPSTFTSVAMRGRAAAEIVFSSDDEDPPKPLPPSKLVTLRSRESETETVHTVDADDGAPPPPPDEEDDLAAYAEGDRHDETSTYEETFTPDSRKSKDTIEHSKKPMSNADSRASNAESHQHRSGSAKQRAFASRQQSSNTPESFQPFTQAPVRSPINSLKGPVLSEALEPEVASPAPSDESIPKQVPAGPVQTVKVETSSTPPPPRLSSPSPEPSPRVLRSGSRPRSVAPPKRTRKQKTRRSPQLPPPIEENSEREQERESRERERTSTIEPDHAGNGNYEATPKEEIVFSPKGSNDDEEEQMVLSQVQPETSAGDRYSEPMQDVDEYDGRSDALEEATMDVDADIDYREISSHPRPPSSIGYSAVGQEPEGSQIDQEMHYASESERDDSQDEGLQAGGPYHTERGAETQAIIEDRRRAIETAKRAVPLPSGLVASDRLPRVFKGKGKVVDRDIDFVDVDFEDSTPQPKAGFSRRPSPPPPSPPRARPSDVPRVPSYGSSRRGSNIAPRTSRVSSPPPPAEDSDYHFNGLDAVMKKALRALCQKYRFSAMDVRQKFNLRHGDLTSTKKCLEDNRRLLDDDSLFQDVTYTYE